MTPSFAQAFFHSAGPKFWAYLAEPAIRALLVGGVAGVAVAALRVKRAPTRLQVWTAVLCAALAMPILAMMLPRMPLAIPASAMEGISQRFSLLKAVTSKQKASGQCAMAGDSQRSAASRAPRTTSVNVAQVFRPEGFRARRAEGLTPPPQRAGIARRGPQTTGVSYMESAEAFRGDRSSESRLPIPSAAQDRFGLGAPAEMPVMPLRLVPVVADEAAIPRTQMAGAIALGFYALVALILLARLLAGVWLSGKLGRAAREIAPLYFTGGGDAQNVQAREAVRMLRLRSAIAGLRNAPLLKESAAISVPATIGVARPAILLPVDWRAWSDEQLDAILAHEISHVARRDALAQTASLAHRAIFWFSPLAWWLDRQLTELAEQASDEAALAGGADRTRYAETLLGFFAQLENAQGRIWWQGVSMAKKSHAGRAERRVDRILAWKGSRGTRKWFAMALVAFAAPVIFVAASVHPVIAYGQDKTQSDSQNVIMPGGPKAPALPKAPKGGVNGGVAAPAIAPAPEGAPVAPAIANAPHGGVVTPAMPPAPADSPTGGVRGGVSGSRRTMPAPSAQPALMPVPGAPEHPPVVPGPIAGAVGNGAITPSAPMAAVIPTAPVASTAPMASAALAAQDSTSAHIVVGDTADDHAMNEKLRAAQKELRDAEKQLQASTSQLRAAQEAVRQARKESLKGDSEQMRAAEEKLAAAENARAESEAARAKFEAQLDAQQERADVEEARRAREDQQNVVRISSVNFYGHGPRYVIMSGADEGVEMSGDDEDFHHAQELRKKLGKDLIWFERDEKSYVITDPAFIAKAKALFAPEEELSKQQDELGRQQDELGRQQDALGEQMDKVSVKPPDVTADLQRIEARLKELQATGATQRELGELQRELGELQSRVGRVQSEAGVQQSAIGRQQGELGRKQGELGRKQGELGRRQGEIAREATRQLRTMFDEAIKSGVAKPE